MMHDLWCPRCKEDVEAVDLRGRTFECTKCKLGGFWDEQCTEDFSDCWDNPEWDSFEEKK